MEATLLRMLSLLRRTRVYYINRTILLYVGPLPTEAIVTPTGSQPRRQYLPRRQVLWQVLPLRQVLPRRQVLPHRQVLPRRQDLPNRGFLPNWKSPDPTSRTPARFLLTPLAFPGYSRNMWLHVYPERAGIPELERGCHSSLGFSGDISIPHLGVSRGHRNVPIDSANHYTITPDSVGFSTGLPTDWIRHFRQVPLLPRIY